MPASTNVSIPSSGHSSEGARHSEIGGAVLAKAAHVQDLILKRVIFNPFFGRQNLRIRDGGLPFPSAGRVVLRRLSSGKFAACPAPKPHSVSAAVKSDTCVAFGGKERARRKLRRLRSLNLRQICRRLRTSRKRGARLACRRRHQTARSEKRAFGTGTEYNKNNNPN